MKLLINIHEWLNRFSLINVQRILSSIQKHKSKMNGCLAESDFSILKMTSSLSTQVWWLRRSEAGPPFCRQALPPSKFPNCPRQLNPEVEDADFLWQQSTKMTRRPSPKKKTLSGTKWQSYKTLFSADGMAKYARIRVTKLGDFWVAFESSLRVFGKDQKW